MKYHGFLVADFKSDEIYKTRKDFLPWELGHDRVGMDRNHYLFITCMNPYCIIKIFMLIWRELHEDILVQPWGQVALFIEFYSK